MYLDTNVKIEQEKSIRFENVVSLRKKMPDSEINREITKLTQFLEEKGAYKKGPMITAIHSETIENGQHILDMEILIPVDRIIPLPAIYNFKKVFHLVSAVSARNKGNLENLESTYLTLQKYIEDNGLQQITAAYLVHRNDEETMVGGGPIIDIYIGVNPSVL